ncbi:MAG: hypothetical protein BalsKO_22060 [Balneolaceae bacterium]
MNKGYKLVSLTVFLITVTFSGLVNAQDTLVVEWLNEAQTEVLENSLFETIIADTNASGERNPNRVYKLLQGGFYYVTETIENNGFPLNIVGEPGDPNDAVKNPPMIQIGAREDATSPGKMFNVRYDFTLKNVIVNGKTTLGALQYEIIDVRGDDGRHIFDNVIFEYAQWGIAGFYGQNSDIWFTNNVFRNFVSESQPWGGRGFSIWTDVDTVWVENNTFSNIGGFAGQMQGGSVNFLLFNQNTIVNNGRQVLLASQIINAYITNNLVLNGFWQGESGSEISASRLESTDEQYSGMFNIETLQSDYGLDAQRRIVIGNNAFFLESTYTDYYAADNDTFDIRKQPLMNVRTTQLFDENANMVYSGNIFDTEDPSFTTYPDNNTDRVNFITDVRQGNSPVRLHYWDPGRDPSNESIQWPLPEDLTYSNSTLKSAAYGGYPLGDLNWYPSDKADWWANRDAQYALIEEELGEVVTVTYASSVEAEKGTNGGNAITEAAPNRLLARIEAAGNIVWSDVQMTAGTYDVEVSHRTWYEDGSVARQTDLAVNDAAAVPIQIGVEQDGTTWSDVTTSDITFAEGSNSVALNRSWGYMEYQWVKIKEAGTENVVATLWPGEAELVDGGNYRCPDGGTCASSDLVVDTKDGGSVTLNYNSEGMGNYNVRVNYLLTDGDADLTVTVNGAEFSTETLTASGDSTLASFDFTGINLNQGDNEIILNAASGGVQVDILDFFILGELTMVSNENEDKVSGFELSQNYPNPFNPSTNINFTLPVASNVQLTVFNLLGQKVATLVSERRNAGNHSVRFDARSLSSGIYFYQLQAGDLTLQRKMTLIK